MSIESAPPVALFKYSLRETIDPETFNLGGESEWDRVFLLGTSFGLVLAFDCDPIEPDYLLRSSCCFTGLLPQQSSRSRYRSCETCKETSQVPNEIPCTSRSYIDESDLTMFELWVSSYTDPLRSHLIADELLELVQWLQSWAHSLGYDRWLRRDIGSMTGHFADPHAYLTRSK